MVPGSALQSVAVAASCHFSRRNNMSWQVYAAQGRTIWGADAMCCGSGTTAIVMEAPRLRLTRCRLHEGSCRVVEALVEELRNGTLAWLRYRPASIIMKSMLSQRADISKPAKEVKRLVL